MELTTLMEYFLHLSSFFPISCVGKMLGQILVTKQTGPQGKVVSKVKLSFH